MSSYITLPSRWLRNVPVQLCTERLKIKFQSKVLAYLTTYFSVNFEGDKPDKNRYF